MMSQSMSKKPYNDIYERLTKGRAAIQEELIGMVAYSLYKQSKAEACEKARNAGNPLTPQELDSFHANFNQTYQDALESKAQAALVAFAEAYHEQRKPQVVKEAIESLKNDVGSIKMHVTTEVEKHTNFWKAFWPGIASSAAFLFFGALFAFGWAINNVEIMRNFLNLLSPPKAVYVEPVPNGVITPELSVNNRQTPVIKKQLTPCSRNYLIEIQHILILHWAFREAQPHCRGPLVVADMDVVVEGPEYPQHRLYA